LGASLEPFNTSLKVRSAICDHAGRHSQLDGAPGLAQNHLSQAKTYAALGSRAVFPEQLLEADLFLSRGQEGGWAALLAHIQDSAAAKEGAGHAKLAQVILDDILIVFTIIVSFTPLFSTQLVSSAPDSATIFGSTPPHWMRPSTATRMTSRSSGVTHIFSPGVLVDAST
jgi:hypothetical protein